MFEYGGGAGDQPRTDRTRGRQILGAHRPLAAVAQPFVEAARLVICSQHNSSRSSNESARLNELHEAPTVSLAAELVVDTKRSHAHDLVAKCDHATTNPRAVFEDQHELVISVESGAGFVEAPVRRSPRLAELAPNCEIEVL
jgi:hypothetical protein